MLPSLNLILGKGLSISQKVASLFRNGEQGVWYDPSDFSTMFQDAAGTIPVTAVGQAVGRILDKSGRGNHATQTTSTKRPVLSARVNRLLQTENLDGNSWSKQFGGTGVAPVVTPGFEAPNGTLTAFRLQLNKGSGTTASDLSHITATSFVSSALVKTSSIWIKSLSGTPAIVFRNNGASSALTTITNDWVLYSLKNVAVTAPEDLFQVILRGSFNTSNSCDLLLWHPDDRASNDAIGSPSYQRVNTATDYDTVGFPFYLLFDGIDDALQTASVDFTGTDKVTVWAGVRKLSDAATSVLAELSLSVDTNNGSFSITAPSGNGSNSYRFTNKGTTQSLAGTGIFAAAPDTAVIACIGDISGNVSKLRRNTTDITTNILNQGTGNYGNYQLDIGSRGGTTLPFNGRLYSMIIRGAQSTATQISTAETYVNSKTGAY